jgi:hypothetical protein
MISDDIYVWIFILYLFIKVITLSGRVKELEKHHAPRPPIQSKESIEKST